MKNFQFIIFITIFIILFLLFGFTSLMIINYNTKKCGDSEKFVAVSAIEHDTGTSSIQKANVQSVQKNQGIRNLNRDLPVLLKDRFSKIGKVTDVLENDLLKNKGSVLESFEGSKLIDEANFQNTLPNPNLDKSIQKSDFNKNLIPLAEPIPGDDMVYHENDKIYINPFFPNDFEKSTAKKGDKPNQHYPDPKEMNSVERNAFKFGYPNYMTMQDYVNWIFLFKEMPNLLNLQHYINYERLINGTPIHYQKGVAPPPAKRLTPLNSDDYFVQMYTENPKRRVHQLTQMINQDTKVAFNQGSPTNGMLPYNYNEYGDFTQNFNVMGETGHIYNPELADKTDPYFLQNIVGPNWERKGLVIPQVTS